MNDGKKPCYWGTIVIYVFKKECMHTRRVLHKARHRNEDCTQKLDEYREIRKRLKVEIKKCVENCWRDLCKRVEVDLWGIPYKLVTKKQVCCRLIMGLTIPGWLEQIVDMLFPRHQVPRWFKTTRGGNWGGSTDNQ